MLNFWPMLLFIIKLKTAKSNWWWFTTCCYRIGSRKLSRLEVGWGNKKFRPTNCSMIISTALSMCQWAQKQDTSLQRRSVNSTSNILSKHGVVYSQMFIKHYSNLISMIYKRYQKKRSLYSMPVLLMIRLK